MQERSDKPATVSHHSVTTRVLLVEDNIPDARMIREMLRDSEEGHFDLEVASRLSEAISLVREAPFDIVLLDLGLPDSQGLETLTAYLESAAEIPVIVLTGLADDAISMQAVASGAQDYLVKGRIDGPMLARAIRYAISRKRQEGALRQSEERYRAVAHSATDAIISADSEGNIVHWNRGAETIFGYSEAEVIGQPATLLIPSRFREEHLPGMARMRAGEEPHILGEVVEMEGVRKDGSEFPIEFSLAAWQVADRRYYTAIVRDITERKRAEEEIRALAKFPSENPDPIMRIATDGTLLYINEIGSRHLSDWHLQAGKIVPPMLRDTVSRAMNHGSRQVFDLEHNESVYSFTVASISGAGYANLYGRNITDRKRAEETLRQSERKLSLHLQQTMFAVIEWDDEYRVREWNPAATAIFGYSREEAMGRHLSELILPRSITEEIGKVMSHLLSQSGETRNTNENVTRDGRVIVCEWINTPLTDERGTAIGGISFALDITERKRAEDDLRRSENRFATVFRASPICTSLSRLSDGVFLDINEAFLRLFGYDRDQVIGSNPQMLNMWVNPDDRARMVETLRERGKAEGFETAFRTKSGEIRNVIVISEVIDEAGDQYILGLTLDITDHKNAEAEKEKLQAQLLQAMKMEAVGRLAGGVAHDFNNLLTVITGYCEILMQKVGEESPMYHEMTEIQRAGERAASLTQQLLAFSRKQIIEPKVVNLDHLVAEIHKMLTRLIGEDIALQATTGKSLGSVKVDPGQFQQILMNLVVNARDAMPEGGKIVIETANVDLDEVYSANHSYVKPGRFVMLAVSDMGMGMSEEVKAHIFEPFFTTKEKGKGTGLGLATTYGVVKRAGGSIEVYSEVGIGTTFKIYLPRVEEEAVKPLKSVLSRDLPGGTETVLLVEDEDSVRDLCFQILVRLGYKVLRGSNGTEAIAAAQGYGDRIDLLLTDVVMPGMSGAELATQLALHHPEMKVLFTSGYTDDAITRHGILDEGVSFIGKPYTPLGLARKVREVLDET